MVGVMEAKVIIQTRFDGDWVAGAFQEVSIKRLGVEYRGFQK